MDDAITRRLRALTEDYTEALNAAVAEDRDDIVRLLVSEYPDHAAAVLTGDRDSAAA